MGRFVEAIKSGSWLNLNEGYLPVVSRVIGLCLLGIFHREIALLYFSKPFNVPAWRIGYWMPELPNFPLWLIIIQWTAYLVCAIALLAGKRHKALAIIPAAILLSGSFKENGAFCSTYVILLFTFLVALCFHKQPVSCSRRLIQISITNCYFFAVANKFHPEFWSGRSLYEVLHYGVDVRSPFLPLMSFFNFSLEQSMLFSHLTILVEVFLVIGPWFEKTRKAAYATAIILHSVFGILFDGVEVFSLVMVGGLLVFFEKKNEPRPQNIPAPRWQKIAAYCLIVAMTALPLRYYFIPAKEYLSMSFLDRAPWSFAMFLFMDEPKVCLLRYRDDAGTWHDINPESRMAKIQSTNDILALFKYLAATYANAQEIQVEIDLYRNHFEHHRKVGQYLRSKDGWQVHVSTL